jgi:hypothetical protein
MSTIPDYSVIDEQYGNNGYFSTFLNTNTTITLGAVSNTNDCMVIYSGIDSNNRLVVVYTSIINYINSSTLKNITASSILFNIKYYNPYNTPVNGGDNPDVIIYNPAPTITGWNIFPPLPTSNNSISLNSYKYISTTNFNYYSIDNYTATMDSNSIYISYCERENRSNTNFTYRIYLLKVDVSFTSSDTISAVSSNFAPGIVLPTIGSRSVYQNNNLGTIYVPQIKSICVNNTIPTSGYKGIYVGGDNFAEPYSVTATKNFLFVLKFLLDASGNLAYSTDFNGTIISRTSNINRLTTYTLTSTS